MRPISWLLGNHTWISFFYSLWSYEKIVPALARNKQSLLQIDGSIENSPVGIISMDVWCDSSMNLNKEIHIII